MVYSIKQRDGRITGVRRQTAKPSARTHSNFKRGNFLDELPENLRRTVLLINEKIPSGAIVDDAEELAKYERLARGTNGFLDFVAKAIA